MLYGRTGRRIGKEGAKVFTFPNFLYSNLCPQPTLTTLPCTGKTSLWWIGNIASGLLLYYFRVINNKETWGSSSSFPTLCHTINLMFCTSLETLCCLTLKLIRGWELKNPAGAVRVQWLLECSRSCSLKMPNILYLCLSCTLRQFEGGHEITEKSFCVHVFLIYIKAIILSYLPNTIFQVLIHESSCKQNSPLFQKQIIQEHWGLSLKLLLPQGLFCTKFNLFCTQRQKHLEAWSLMGPRYLLLALCVCVCYKG